MTVRLPPLFLGKAGILHPAQNDRLGLLSAMFRPATGQDAVTNPLTVSSGAIYGPAGTMGELTLLNPTTLRVNPARFVVQGTQNALQGAYEVINDAILDLAVTARHGSQYRRSLAVVYVRDSSVAGGANDDAILTTIDGALSATNGGAVLPSGGTLPSNLLALGELFIPPTTDAGAVTLTPYNPRTLTRGGILPVIADGAVRSGHDGELPAFDGQYRHHPANGLEVGAGGLWRPSSPQGFAFARLRQTTGQTNLPNGFWDVFMQGEEYDSHNAHEGVNFPARWTCPAAQAGTYAVQGVANISGTAGWTVGARVCKNLAAVNGGQSHLPLGGTGAVSVNIPTPRVFVDLVAGDFVYLQGYCSGAGGYTSVGGATNEGVGSTLTVERIR